MKRKEFIKRIRNVYLQVCIPKILKPAFGEGTSFPKLSFVNYNNCLSGFTRFNSIYLNIKSIRDSVDGKDKNLILGTAAYVLIHECTHQIQRTNVSEYTIDKNYHKFVEDECDATATRIFKENISHINHILNSNLTITASTDLDISKFKDIRSSLELNKNLIYTTFSRFIRQHCYLKNIEICDKLNCIFEFKNRTLEVGIYDHGNFNKKNLNLVNNQIYNFINIEYQFIESDDSKEIYIRMRCYNRERFLSTTKYLKRKRV